MDHPGERPTWTFLTHHARVLILIARDPGIRLRDVAAACDLTERRVQGIVADLETAGYLTHTRVGRRNHYQVVPGTRFRHPAEAGQQIAGLLALVNGGTGPGPDPAPEPDGTTDQQRLGAQERPEAADEAGAPASVAPTPPAAPFAPAPGEAVPAVG